MPESGKGCERSLGRGSHAPRRRFCTIGLGKMHEDSKFGENFGAEKKRRLWLARVSDASAGAGFRQAIESVAHI